MIASKETIEKLSRAIMESPIRLMSPDEVANGDQLTEGEFLARAKAFVNDPESGIPGGKASADLTMAVLAKNLRRRLPAEVAEKLMKPLVEGSEPSDAITVSHNTQQAFRERVETREESTTKDIKAKTKASGKKATKPKSKAKKTSAKTKAKKTTKKKAS